MTQIIKGSFNDFRGKGWFVSLFSERGHVLLAIRSPWRLAFVRPESKPTYRRLYIGPVEIEWSQPHDPT